MDVNPEELYAYFGELLAVQGINLKRAGAQVTDLNKRLVVALERVKELEADKPNTGEEGES